MADANGKKSADRRIAHCLRCHKPQDNLPKHLKRACMKRCTPEERAAEVQKAKKSSKDWIWANRSWNYNDIVALLPHRRCRMALVKELLQRGFFINNMPYIAHSADLENLAGDTATTATATTPTAPVAPAEAATSGPPSPEGSVSSRLLRLSSSSSSSDSETSDPSWQKYGRLVESTHSVSERQEILRVAKTDFLDVYRRLLVKKNVSNNRKTMYRYYCEAVVVLAHYQRPGVAEGMTVQEWVNRVPEGRRTVIAVSNQKTPSAQFSLTAEEEAWLQAYYEHIRPDDVGIGDCDSFFLSTKGGPLSNVTSDISRLHDMFKLPKVASSQEIRRAVETEATLRFSESQRESVTHYLGHSTDVADRHNRMQMAENTVTMAVRLDSVSDFSPHTSGQEAAAAAAAPSITRDKEFSDFVERFPVSRDGQPPYKKERVDAGFPEDRFFYDKWRGCQYTEREKYLLSHFTQRKQSAMEVGRLIKKEGWVANYPKPEDILEKWCPAPKHIVENDMAILKSVSTQRWKGLAIKDFGGEKGQGVVATRNFTKGDIICDYHGKLITAAEGRLLMQDMQDEQGYLLFFKNHCIDAQTFPCECHPNLDTFGRRISHSRKDPNLKSLHYVLRVDGEDKDVILFRALEDIKVDTELKFDYGVNRRSFRGVGLDLE
ncbi:hypothetical protein ACEWY4_011130 [Coilia grayii]|uniref:SET domain-containing protein n=1 Tax=Coilia grayii TaxID=363190 RepID=A0ABD1K3X8_9TELE